ncbi:MAG: hypothetical protein AB7T86_04940 [Xanthobacteraceae bacterium]
MRDWKNPDHLRLLRELTSYYMLREADGAGMSMTKLLRAAAEYLPEAMRQEVDGWAGGADAPASYHALERFLYFETRNPRKTEIHEALFQHVLAWFHANQTDPKVANSKFLESVTNFGWFTVLGKPQPARPAMDAGLTLETLELLADHLKIDPLSATRAAARKLTGRETCAGDVPTEEDWQGYETYRYSVRPGRVVKTFTAFSPPSAMRPFCTFYNVYTSEDGQRSKHASGIAMEFEQGIYCVGRLHDGKDTTTTGLKIIALPVQVWGGMLHGFVLTRDEEARLLIARTVLKPTAAKTDKVCIPTVVPFGDVSKTIPDDVLRRIRNTVKFEVERLIYCTETKRYLSADQMVHVVAELCGNRFMLDDKDFNPASHDYYPFNQALVPYSGSESYTPWATSSRKDAKRRP